MIGTHAQAAATLRAISDAGLRIPHDITLVGYDADDANTYTPLMLTSVVQPIDDLARTALSRVLDAAGNSPTTAATHPFEVGIRLGETCGCAPERTVSQPG